MINSTERSDILVFNCYLCHVRFLLTCYVCSTKIGEISDISKCFENFVSQALGVLTRIYAAELRNFMYYHNLILVQDKMNEIIEYILGKENLLLDIFTIVFTVMYSLSVIRLLGKLKARKLERKKIFINTFITGISDNTIANSTDLLNIYSGITKLSPEDLTNRQDLNKWLREILAKLINKEVGQDLVQDKVIEIKEKITNFIKENETTNPYTDLPDTERSIINDLSAFNKLGDQNSINRKLSELSSVIITRHEQQKKIENLNKWSIPLAIIGMVLTIIFGILSII